MAPMCLSIAGVLLLGLSLVATVPAGRAHADPVDDYVTGEMAKRRIPGLTLAVVRSGAVVKMQGYGFANLDHEVPVTPDTVFELASVTKQFTAAGIMLLVEENKVRLDDPIGQHLPRAPETWRGITVRHLLTHTGGMPGLEDGFKTLRAGGWRVNYTTEAMFAAAAKDTLGGAPGERFQYSDVGYFLLGMIIESASGQRYADFLEQRFWRPLGMTSTSVLDQWRILKHRAAGYTLRDGQLINIRRISQVELPSHYGVFSTVKDLVAWDAALASGRVLRPVSLAQLWSPVRLGSGALFPYGFGWFFDDRRGHRVISHTGITGTEYTRYPDDDMTVIVLTNLGAQIGAPPGAVNPWGLTHGIAGRYVPDLLLSAVAERPDPDPALTQRISDLLAALGRGEDSPLLQPSLRASIDQSVRSVLATRLRTLRSFTFLACDDLAQPAVARTGDPVARRCYYRAVNAWETRYYTFWLAADGRVADISSSLD